MVRLRRQKRVVLFDLGEGQRLPARLAHHVTDVFISHAHMDHIAGFLWLLRSRIGDLPPCRLYGPPGLVNRIGALMDGIHWDRIGPLGPVFEVTEFDPSQPSFSFELSVGPGDVRSFTSAGDPNVPVAAPAATLRSGTLVVSQRP